MPNAPIRPIYAASNSGERTMFMFKKSLDIPSKADALPGRPNPIRTAATHFVNGNPLKGPYPAGFETAIFGFGCFWGAERKFWELGDGIYTTAVGYAGGLTPNPTYEEVCSGRTGHTEVVLVVFDPKLISYDALLKTFWENHDPTQGMRQGNDVGTQYRSAIYTYSEDQAAGGKMFAATGPGGGLSFKANDVAFEMLIETGAAKPAPYAARQKWVLVDDPKTFTDADLRTYLTEAHALIAAKLSGKLQRELGM